MIKNVIIKGKLIEINEEIDFKLASYFDSTFMRWKEIWSLWNDDIDWCVKWSFLSSDYINLIVVNLSTDLTKLTRLDYMNVSTVDQWVKYSSSECKVISRICNDDCIFWWWQCNRLYSNIIDFEESVWSIVHDGLEIKVNLLWICRLLGKSNDLIARVFLNSDTCQVLMGRLMPEMVAQWQDCLMHRWRCLFRVEHWVRKLDRRCCFIAIIYRVQMHLWL